MLRLQGGPPEIVQQPTKHRQLRSSSFRSQVADRRYLCLEFRQMTATPRDIAKMPIPRKAERNEHKAGLHRVHLEVIHCRFSVRLAGPCPVHLCVREVLFLAGDRPVTACVTSA